MRSSGSYGNAVLWRFPIVKSKNYALPNIDDGEQRGVLEVEIRHPRIDDPVLLLATHFDNRIDSREREASARFINGLYGGRNNDSIALLSGDLNATPESDTLKVIEQLWTRSNEAILPTVPVTDPKRQIDYVLFKFRPSPRWRVVETIVLDEQVASDHRPILAVLELMNEGKKK